ncbi:MAG: hypothetical protein K6B13_02845 [Prevotella sp.]|nr:hypothetical protein [Prevotella sp.]
MTNEEREVLRPLIEGVFQECGRLYTDEMVEQALDKIDKISKNSPSVVYSYKHPDYGKMVEAIPDVLMPLVEEKDPDDHSDVPDIDDLMDSCSSLDRSVLAEGVCRLIYHWLNKWHHALDDDAADDGVWLYPLHVAILIVERFKLRECLPALLEMERQDREFAESLFDEYDLVGMLPASIYQIISEDDLPLLHDFMCERGIYPFCKADVLAAVGTLPRRSPETLSAVQKWLCGLLELFADHIDPEMGDILLLETIVHCCIHTRCEAAKPMIIRLYCKYKMPNFLIPGGVNEVRKTIKRANIGVLREEMESAEEIFWNSFDGYDDDFDDEDDDYYDDDDSFYFDEDDDDSFDFDEDDEDYFDDDDEDYFDEDAEDFDEFEEIIDEDEDSDEEGKVK